MNNLQAAETRLDFARNVISRYTEMAVLYEHYYMEQANAVAEIIDSSIGTALTGDMPRNTLNRRKRLARSAGLHPIAATSQYNENGAAAHDRLGGPRLPSYAALPPDVQASMREAVESLAEQQSRYDMRPAALSALELAQDRQGMQQRDTRERETLRKEADDARDFISNVRTNSRRRRGNSSAYSENRDQKNPTDSPEPKRSTKKQDTCRQRDGQSEEYSASRGPKQSAVSADDSFSSSLTPLQPRSVTEFDGFRRRVQQRLNQSLRSYETLKSSWKNGINSDTDETSDSESDVDSVSHGFDQAEEAPKKSSSGASLKENYSRGDRRRSSFEELRRSAESIRDGLKDSRRNASRQQDSRL